MHGHYNKYVHSFTCIAMSKECTCFTCKELEIAWFQIRIFRPLKCLNGHSRLFSELRDGFQY